MSLTEVAIKNNRVTAIITVLLIFSGITAFIQLPKAQDPGFIVRTAVITTRLPGASPERVEQLITDKIEKKAQEMPEVDDITSESRTGISIIKVNFKESYKNMRPIFDDLRRKIDDVQNELPAGTRPSNVNDEFGDVFGSVYALTGDGFSYAELKDVADDLRDQLLKEPDVAKVSLHGPQEENIFVDYNNARLTELGLSPQQLSGALSSANILSSGGDIRSGRERIVLEPTGNFESVDDLARTVVPLPDGSIVYLRDIASIYRGYSDPPASVTRVNGKPAIAVAVSMRDGGDILKLGARLDATIPDLMTAYPWGIELEKIWFQAELVESNVNNFLNSLLQAILIVVVVIVAFLGLRTGLVVTTLIPATMVISFYLMQIFGITVNQISLAALIIALGLLVDNAIVIVESILVKREHGKDALTAAVESGKELMAPLLVSSLTTAAAFMPIALAESAVGEYTADIFYVVTIALLISWCLAMTLLPMLSTFALKVEANTGHSKLDAWYERYRGLLRFCLRNRLAFSVMVVGVFASAIYAMGFVRAEFIAPSEDPLFTGKLELPIGTAIEASSDVTKTIDQFIQDTYFEPVDGSEPLVKNWLMFIGEGGPRFTLGLDPPNQNAANTFLVVNTVNGKVTDQVIQGIRDYLFQEQPDLNSQIARLENGPPVGYPIQVRLSGDDADTLYQMADETTTLLFDTPGLTSVKNSWGPQTKKLVVDVDQDRARRAGVTSDDVAYSLQTSLSGIEMTEYREDDTLIPVTLRTVQADRQDIRKLDGMSVFSSTSGSTVPLRQVADVKLTFEPGMIERRDRVRTLTLLAQLDASTTAVQANSIIIPKLEGTSEQWPKGYGFEIGGESESSGEANQAIAAKLPLALATIVLLLVVQFNSVRRPIIVISTIPLGLIGVAYGLLLAQSTFGFFTILGIISLAGIIINNAIVLLDRIAIEKDKGLSHQDAIIEACVQRVRPILLTTGTTVLGMMPLWWGGTAMFRPMAITIIFGLLFATLLTLLVVPVMYSAFFRVSFR